MPTTCNYSECYFWFVFN